MSRQNASPTESNGPKHVLLTVLGLAPRETTYVLGEAEEQAALAPVALYRLLSEEQRPHRVVALCTEDASETFQQLKSDLLIEAEEVSVPDGADDKAIEEFLRALTEAFPPNCPVDVTLDVTHGFRHFSFLTYVGALYLQALRGDAFRVRGAHYGLYDQEQARSRFFDLRPLLELPRWAHALTTLEETGSAQGIASLLEPVPQKVRGTMADWLQDLSRARLSGLPLEAGRRAFELTKRKKLLTKSLQHLQVPLAKELTAHLSGILHPLEKVPPGGKGKDWPKQGWKRTAALDEAELARQRRLIDRLFAEGHATSAVGLLREYAVNWVLWHTGAADEWLERDARQRAEQQLHTLRMLTVDESGAGQPGAGDETNAPLLDPPQRKLGKFWDDLTSLRNGLHHHGMRPQDLLSDVKANANFLTQRWDALSDPNALLPQSQTERLLISPCGLAPGSLYTAVLETRPTRVLVVCSDSSRSLAKQALNEAGFTDEDHINIEPLEHPFGPSAAPEKDIEALGKKYRRVLFGASEVVANLTGGTTWMGLVVQGLADEASRLSRPVRRFGLIDTRSSEEQRRAPFQPGQVVWLASTTQET